MNTTSDLGRAAFDRRRAARSFVNVISADMRAPPWHRLRDGAGVTRRDMACRLTQHNAAHRALKQPQHARAYACARALSLRVLTCIACATPRAHYYSPLRLPACTLCTRAPRCCRARAHAHATRARHSLLRARARGTRTAQNTTCLLLHCAFLAFASAHRL